MRKRATEDRDLLVRAITATARVLRADSPLFPQVVTWLVDNVQVLPGLFGAESQMYWEIQYTRSPDMNRDDHIIAVMKRHGYLPEDLEAVRRKYDRWKSRCRDIFALNAPLGEVLYDCLRHLY